MKHSINWPRASLKNIICQKECTTIACSCRKAGVSCRIWFGHCLETASTNFLLENIKICSEEGERETEEDIQTYYI